MIHQTKDLRSFAYIWAAIFTFIGVIPLFKNHDIKIWALGIAVAFILIAWIKPALLQSFYVLWTKVGEFIGGIISKIMLAILFYFIFTPVAVILRLLKKDLLHKRIDKTVSSYWIEREQQPESMKNQF